MSVSQIVTFGFGVEGSPSSIVTFGFNIGEAVITPLRRVCFSGVAAQTMGFSGVAVQKTNFTGQARNDCD